MTSPSDKRKLLEEVKEAVAAIVRTDIEVATDLTKVGPTFERLYPELHDRLKRLYADRKHYSWLVYVVQHTRRVIDQDGSHEWHAEDGRWHRI